MATQTQTTREGEDALILALCREAGDTWADGDDAKVIDGFRGNHHPQVIADAAAGDVAALVELRQACGLPIFS